ncbi:peptidylprolyl isomerase [Stenotrophomonas ginsengisoli]|uniref:Peptidyl-prolyl cis-trans isomerase n=2 Tax=Stenotrophomonas ginsengisoli TaxID=336566 RepID=A0A0R0D5R9_9GAMM|nr:peptidylprolyl isomerase [Stenotrophomonas ginsengisoli]
MPRSLFTLPLLAALAACTPAPQALPPSDPISQFQIIDQQPGDGASAQPGQKVSVHYTGWLFDADAPQQRGAKFDSSLDRGQPFSFTVGAGQVIRGWDEGVAGMQIGATRVLMIPPDYGYGERRVGPLSANASLVFEVQLLGIESR